MRLQHYLSLAILATPSLCTAVTNINFDGFVASSFTVTTPIDIVQDMKFKYFVAFDAEATIAGGVQPASPKNIAATSLQIQVLGGALTRFPLKLQPAKFTVDYPGSTHTKFTLKEVSIACAVASTATAAYAVAPCRVRFTPVDVNGGALAYREVEYKPDAKILTDKSSMGTFTFGDNFPQFRNIGGVIVELASADPLVGIGLDSIKVVYH